MSIKDQVEYAKEELTQDEKLLAGLIKAERFYRKYKYLILAVIVALVVATAWYGVANYLKQKRVAAANDALLILQKNSDDLEALKSLQENSPKLANLFLLKKGVTDSNLATLQKLSKSDDQLIADLASYHLGALKSDIEKLQEYRMKSKALLRDFAIFNEAYLLMKEGKVDEAKDRLSLIGPDSPLRSVASMLEHYGVTSDGRGENE